MSNIQEQIQSNKPIDQSNEQKTKQDTEQDQSVSIEQESCQIVRDLRVKLDVAFQMQKSTTEELKKQGETIEKVKNSSIKTFRNSKLSSDTQFKLREESSIIPSFSRYYNRMKKWWNRNLKLEREVSEIENKKAENRNARSSDTNKTSGGYITNELLESSIVDEEYQPMTCEVVSGENNTNKELSMLLSSIRRVKSGAMEQREIIRGQNEDLEDIKKVNDFTSKIVSDTETELKKK